MIKVGVVGVTGYAGGELVRLLLGHREVRVAALVSRSRAGERAEEIFPNLRGAGLTLADAGALADCRAVFLAMPHGQAMETAPELLADGATVVDLGADYRLRDAGLYREWYKLEHSSPQLLSQAVYGLPEFYRDRLRRARLIAAPGCYPTATLLACLPLLEAGVIAADSIIVNAASGVSGAGGSPSREMLFAEVGENFRAYGAGGTHRHIPEMEQELAAAAGKPVKITFTPHYVPMTRGILVTVYANLTHSLETEDLLAILRDRYAGEPFIRVTDGLPQTKAVAGSNHCHLGARVDRRTGRAVVFAAIDNLGKGAAGQAIQGFNLAFGLPETEGLTGLGLYP